MQIDLVDAAVGRVVVSALTVACALAACNETFPREETNAPPPLREEPVSGLSARPRGATCGARVRGAPLGKIALERLDLPKLAEPVEIVVEGGRFYVLEKAGVVRLLAPAAKAASTVADLRSRVDAQGEGGLLGIAFHPRFADNGYVYLYYTAPHPTIPPPAGVAFQSVLARYESRDRGLTLDLATEKRLLVLDQPFSNHNGATIGFGNDGFLYWSLGDGGGNTADPMNNAQNKGTLLGKILRLDVDGGDPYAVPPTNPFAEGGGRPEIYALGFRNPYRFRFDRATGDLWVGDVGHLAREEIDKVILGGNYGWKIREGKTCFEAATCDAAGLIDPVVDHPRSEATVITGGVVYRGSALPDLRGHYVYADFGTSIFFSFPADAPSPTPARLDDAALPRINPAAFALDPSGEIVVASYRGDVFRIVAPPPPNAAPPRLSETGCHDPVGTFPYDVVVPQWLDGASAERSLALPPGAKLSLRPDGRLDLPPGSVAARTLRVRGKRTETQLLVVRADGVKGAYAYAWNADESEATLDERASATCATCHDDARGLFTLGLEVSQLDRDFDFPGGRRGNVLATLNATGMLDGEVDRTRFAPLAPLDGPGTTAERAQSYLHAQCSYCHVVRDLSACEIPQRMRRVGEGRMPPLGSSTPHEAAVRVVDEWVRSIHACP